MLKLHYAPRTISVAAAIVLEETATPDVAVRVVFAHYPRLAAFGHKMKTRASVQAVYEKGML